MSARGHDYDHIQEEQYMLTFPTSSADLACDGGRRREEGSRDYQETEDEEEVVGAGGVGVSGGVSLVPQPSIYSVPVECDKSPPIVMSTGHHSL